MTAVKKGNPTIAWLKDKLSIRSVIVVILAVLVMVVAVMLIVGYEPADKPIVVAEVAADPSESAESAEIAKLKAELSEAKQKLAEQAEKASEVKAQLETDYGTVYRTVSKAAPKCVWVRSETVPEIEFPVNEETKNFILGTDEGKPPLVVAPGTEYKWVKVTDPRKAGPNFYRWAPSGRLYGRVKIDS